MSEKLTIGKLASATGTKVETIRYYEQIGLLPAPARSAGNYRTYEGEHLRRLSFIRKRPVETVVGNGQFRDAGGGTGMTGFGWIGEWRVWQDYIRVSPGSSGASITRNLLLSSRTKSGSDARYRAKIAGDIRSRAAIAAGEGEALWVIAKIR